MTEFTEILARRRMTRSYSPEPVEHETIERIVGSIQRAPTAGYSQGQRLLVVTDADTRRRIAEIAAEADWTARGNEPWLSVAPVHVLLLTSEADYHERYRRQDKLDVTGGVEVEWPVPYWFVDAGAVMMLVMLAAIDEGLASGFAGFVPPQDDRVKELLGIPPELALDGVITLGRPAGDDASSARASRRTQQRKPLDELVKWERW
ncbi:MAG TPA: nitroreductase family protein [Gaiellaceae bacterium]|nr:nitroreductase family protein [Gaiellaceae bacterium]